MALLSYLEKGRTEAGCDEAGRGCLAGAVYAAAAIWPAELHHELLTDSKKLTHKQRMSMREFILDNALDCAIRSCSPAEIDAINILKASFKAMHKAIDALTLPPEHLLIDGHMFTPYPDLEHTCIVKGDGKYFSIAAASILAKTERDLYMIELSEKYPQYGWEKNKGYPTRQHIEAIKKYGYTPEHRKSFHVKSLEQPELF